MIRNIQKSIASQRVRALMRVLFGIFLFLYFYFLQFPLLEFVQYQLSEGRTTYHHFVSSLVLTVMLLFLQRLVSNWVHFKDSLYFFSYVPSAVFAVLLTAFTPMTNINAMIFVGVALTGFVFAVLYSLKKKSVPIVTEVTYAQLISTHAVGLVGLLFCIGFCSNSNDVVTYENRVAHYSYYSDYEQALSVGKKSLATSKRLTALRAYAMTRCGSGMGTSLFEYPLYEVGAEQLLFSPADSLSQLLSPDSLYVHLQSWRSPRETAYHFLKRISLRHDSNLFVRDYWLNGLLLEKKLDVFLSELSRYYKKSDTISLPRYYQEALLLHSVETDVKSQWKMDSVLKKSYYEFKVYEDMYLDPLIRKNQLRRKYGNTYWWYYYYQN